MHPHQSWSPLANAAGEELLFDRDSTAVLACLISCTPPVTLDDLAAALTESSDETTDVERVRIHLHHIILPWMADVGLLRYHAVDHIVEATN